MKKLVHPHLVSLYEVIDDASQDALYLVLEYVPGGQIMEFDAEERRYFSRAHAGRGGVLGEVEAARVLGDILAGLVYLHVHHIAHRDLKPENVLVGRGGRCKIADFGVSHYFDEEAARVLALTNAPPAVGEGGGEGGKEEKQLHQLYRSTSRGLLNKSDGTWSFWAPEMCRQGGGEGGREGGSFSGYSCDMWATGV
jgi:serine/threonine protein kinase